MDNATLSLVRLNEVLGVSDKKPSNSTSSFITVAVIRFGENRAAFQIDEFFGERDVLVKKLNAPLQRVKYISAATILETGVPVPILSANDLIKSVMKDMLPQRRPNNIAATEDALENGTYLSPKILITTRMLLKNILEMVGYKVLTAVDGADVWRILREQKVALVVSDVEMPKNGWLRANAEYQE